MNTPRDWIDPWPNGHPRPGAPAAAVWLAGLVTTLDRHGWTVPEITTATGLAPRTVTAILDGTRWPTLHTATVLAELPTHRPG